MIDPKAVQGLVAVAEHGLRLAVILRMILIGVVIAALSIGGWLIYGWVTADPYDGRPTMTQSENLIHTQFGEPVRYYTFVEVTEEELRRIRAFSPDDPRVEKFDQKPHLRSDLYLYYRDVLNRKDSPNDR